MDKPIYPLNSPKEAIDLPKFHNPQDLENIIYGLSLTFDPEGFKSRYPFPSSDEHGLRQILTEDNRSRRLKRWPLVPLQDFKFYVTLLKEDFLGYNGNNASVAESKVSSSPTIPILNNISNGFNFVRLDRDFPALKPILTKFKGKLVVAGGAVLRSILGVHKSDCDIFFYGVSEQEATNILFECITLIVTLAMRTRQATGEQIKIKVEHKLYITNVLLVKESGNEVYQFIHRVYPTKDSIIGGFDLGPSMILFDGEQIFSTPLGAYCIAKQCLIVDTSRRSISFEQRIYKLAGLGFKVIFPGINLQTSKKTFENLSGNETQEFRKIADLIRKLGYNFHMSYNKFGQHPTYKKILNKNKMIDLGMIRFDEDYELRYPRPLYATDEDLPKNLLKHYSDYGSTVNGVTLTHDNEIYINGAMLRTENLESVSTSITFPIDQNLNPQDIFDSLTRLFSQPEIKYDIAAYKLRTYKYLMKNRDRINQYYYPIRNMKRETSRFAEFALKVRRLQDKNSDLALDYIKSVVEYLTKRMVSNAKLCEENLKGVKWMTQAVGVQWTSSINPIIENPRDYYGHYYTRFWIGMPCEIETTLRLFRRRPGNYFNSMPKDLFNTILSYVSRAYLYNVFYRVRESEPPVMKRVPIGSANHQPIDNPYTLLYAVNGGQFENNNLMNPQLVVAPILTQFQPPIQNNIQLQPPMLAPQNYGMAYMMNRFNVAYGNQQPAFPLLPQEINSSPEEKQSEESSNEE